MRDVPLSATEEFVAQCSAAVKDRAARAVKEVVEPLTRKTWELWQRRREWDSNPR
jgi:hypothetical protein